MTLYTVHIPGASAAVEVYGGLTACDDYMLEQPGAGAAAYCELEAGSADRMRLLIGATRRINRMRWRGTRNAAGGTTLAFPRDGLLLTDGTAADNAAQLALVSQAAFELVALAALDEEVLSAADQSDNIKAMGAGPARIEFFSPARVKDGTATVLPTAVHELIGHWLAGAGGANASSSSVGGSSTSGGSTSIFGECGGYKRTGAF